MSTAYPSDTTAPLDAVPPQRPTDAPAVPVDPATAGLSTRISFAEAWPGQAWHGVARLGLARLGRAWHGTDLIENDKAPVAAGA